MLPVRSFLGSEEDNYHEIQQRLEGSEVGFTLPHTDVPRTAATMARDITFLGTERPRWVLWSHFQIPPAPRSCTSHMDPVASSLWTAQM